MTIEKLKRHKSPGVDQIPAELIKAGGRIFRSEIHKHINCTWNKEELSEEWKESFIVLLHKKGDKTDCNNYRGNITFVNYVQNFIQHPAVKVTSWKEISGNHHCGFRRNRSTTDRIFCIRQILEKNWEYNKAVHHLFIDFKEAYDSVRRGVLYNILFEFLSP